VPIHDLGYRPWPGGYSSRVLRFGVIATAGVRVVGRNNWVRRVLLAAWLPTIGLAAVFFGYERLLENRRAALTSAEVRSSVLNDLPDGLQDGDAVVEALTKEDLREGRHLMWSWLLSSFLRLPQAVMAMLVIGMIAPPLIARDVRTRAYLTYFSKPIGPAEYVFGKLLVVATYLLFITTVPALGCYLFGVALSSDLGVLADTWDLPLRVVLASLIFIVPAASVGLMFSSLTSESRFAAFAWFAFWGLGFTAWNVTYAVMSDHAHRTAYVERGDPEEFEARLAEVREEIDGHPLAMVSLYDTLVRLQRWVFGLETRWSAVLPAMVVAVSVTLFAWLVLLRNVAALVRV
jgi:ABC-2 type transport system permease protein